MPLKDAFYLIKVSQLKLYLVVHLVGRHDVVHHGPDDDLLGLLLAPPPLPHYDFIVLYTKIYPMSLWWIF